MGFVGNGLHVSFGQKGQTTFGANDKPCNDIERVIKLNERKDIQSHYIFDGILLPDAFGELFVGSHTVAKRFDTPDEIGMGVGEISFTCFITGIEQRSIAQYQSGGTNHSIAVMMNPATHSGSIVEDDAADHSRFHGSRIGRKLSPQRL